MAEKSKIPNPGEIYRHFKGGIYQIRLLARDSADGQDVVVYQAMEPPFACWTRKLADFFSPIDLAKYPDAVQKNRFERVAVESLAAGKRENRRDEGVQAGENGKSSQLTSEETAAQTTERVSDEELEKVLCYGNVDKLVGTRMTEQEVAERGFLLFLDADSSRKKRQIFMGIQAYLNQVQINNIAVTLDLILEEEEKEEQCDMILKCLGAREHYEGGRLR